jgi:LPXTG-site transpeptidase (sortase) family protein
MRPSSEKHLTFFFQLLLALCFCLILFAVPNQTITADPIEVLGGTPIEGNLRITVFNNGSIGVERYTSGSWQTQIYNWMNDPYSSKGFFLQHSEEKYGAYYYSILHRQPDSPKYNCDNGSTNRVVSNISNTKEGNTITSVFRGTNESGISEFSIIQKVTYSNGDPYFHLSYEIENISETVLSDIRFFHGDDTFLLGGDRGAGYWDASNTTTGVQKNDGSGNLQVMALQAVTPPYAYESRYFLSTWKAVTCYGNLEINPTIAINPDPTVDNAYALEWRKATLAPGEVWKIDAYEKFRNLSIGELIVTGPVVTECQAGDDCQMAFTVSNPGLTTVEASLSTSNDHPWTTTVTNPTSPITLLAGTSQNVTVKVSVPGDTPQDTTANITLTANDGAADSNDSGTLLAKEPPPVIDSHNLATLLDNLTQIQITFSKEVSDPAGSTGQDDVTNPANYQLFQKGPNGSYDFSSCDDGTPGDDIFIPSGPVSYDNTTFTSTLTVNNGTPLPTGDYRLLVCGTTSITDNAGNPLNGGSDDSFDFSIQTPLPDALPTTGFPQGQTSRVPAQPSAKMYTHNNGLWLEIPKLGLQLDILGIPVVDGKWDVSWLGNHAGYLQGTAFPTWQGNTVITAHVWDANNQPGPFENLHYLKFGDRFSIHAWGEIYTYEVQETRRILPSQGKSILNQENSDMVTLVTCEWYNPLSRTYLFRRVVKAILIDVSVE